MTIPAELLLSMLLAQAPQQQQAQPQPPSGALVEGIVVDFVSGQPIEGALVELRRGQGATPRIVLSPIGELLTATPPLTMTAGPDGKFTFKDPPVGEYRLYATRMRGHTPAEYGQRTPTGTGTALNIAAGQKITGVTLRMSPVGSISGRIFDASGDLVVYASVEVVRSGYLDGKRRLIRVQIRARMIEASIVSILCRRANTLWSRVRGMRDPPEVHWPMNPPSFRAETDPAKVRVLR